MTDRHTATQPLKILFLADANSIHTRRWVSFLKSRGHTVVVERLLYDLPMAGTIQSTAEAAPYRPSLSGRGLVRHLARLYGAFNRRGLIPTGLHSVAKVALAVVPTRRILRRNPGAIVHNHYLSPEGVAAALCNRKPFIISVWGSDIFRAPDDFVSHRLRRFALRRADYVTTTSHHMREVLLREYGLREDRVLRIPWGIDLTIFRRANDARARTTRTTLGIEPNVRVILSSRAIRPMYRIEVIARAFADALPKLPDSCLVLVSGARPDTEYLGRVVHIADALGISTWIRVLEKALEPEQMADLYSIADAAISVPISDQFSSSNWEAMACEAVPIVAQLPAYYQYLLNGDNALFVRGDDPQELSSAIVRAVTDQEFRHRCGRVNLAIVREHADWGKNAIDMEQLYVRATEEHDHS